MRIFDSDFVFWLLVFVLLFSSAIAISKLFHFNFDLVLLGIMALGWIVLVVWEKRLVRQHGEETPLIYCEWESRINDFDFDANEQSTILSIGDLNLTLEKAIGKTFNFHTEPSLECPDLYFEGIFARDDTDRIVIRANEPLPKY